MLIWLILCHRAEEYGIASETMTLEAHVEWGLVDDIPKPSIALVLINSSRLSGYISVAVPCLNAVQSCVVGLHTRLVDAHAIDWTFLKEWIRACETGHPTCQIGNSATLLLPGFRVVDCSTREIITPPSNSKYAALSYVWGPTTKFSLSLPPLQLPGPVPGGH